MELQLQKRPVPCLRTVLRELQSQEQTQEIRVSDGMPDIGSIVGVWGQVILRGKEWEADSIRISGGTMVWVQYLSEDGEETACMEGWLPFQMQWNLPESEHDGRIICQSFLKSVDARSTSARKMILRTSVALLAEGMEPCECDTYVGDDLPDDVQVRTQSYPVQIPVEAGEKAFVLDEMLTPPANIPGIAKIISYGLQPEVTEEKLMGDKLVFRGKAWLHIHYNSEDKTQHSIDLEIPFSQYCELDREYPQTNAVRILPCVTTLEAELQQERIRLKAGLVCQYRICSSQMLEMVTDAYSNLRSVDCITKPLELPSILESKNRSIMARMNCASDDARMADIGFLNYPVVQERHGDNTELILSGQFRTLYNGPDGELRSSEQLWTESVTIPMDEMVRMDATVTPVGVPRVDMAAGSGQMQLELFMESRHDSGMSCVCAMELGEIREPDPSRPSLILKRAGEKSLWELAKENGSTVERIQAANDLQGEPESDQMLLIPVV